MQEKVRQVLEFGPPNVWVINPRTLEAEVHTPQGSYKVLDGILRVEGTPIEIPLHGLKQSL